MANFSIIALRVLPNNPGNIRKVLKDEWYFFNHSYKLGENDEPIPNSEYSLKDVNNFFSNNINICAIVGKNGSGKSSLLEFMFRMINNLTFWLVKKQQRNAAEHFYYIEDIYGDLYFVINGKLSILHCRGNFVGLKADNYKWGFNFPYGDKQSILSEFQLYDIKDEVLIKEFVEIAKTFFYTIVTNYSLQAFLDSDYTERCGHFDANGKSGYDSTGVWINSMFHKNDGYSAPIVLNPYRDKGEINLATEYQLTNQRLAAIFIESKKRNKQFIDDYQLNSINYRYEPANILRKFSNYKHKDNLHKNFMNAWQQGNTFASVILEKYGYKFTHNISDEQKDAYLYLVYKTLNIISKYPSYNDYSNLGNKENFRKKVVSEKRDLENLVKDILKDKSHITLKITQTRNFLRECDMQALSTFQKRDLDFTYDDYINTLQLKTELRDLYEIMEYLPPPFFEYEITLDKIEKGKIISDKNNPISFKTMSSGEKQFLYAVSTLIYHIKNLRSIQQSHRVKYRHINLVLDEIELCFHPEYQRKFINKLIETIKRLRLNSNGCAINIIFATHSPFILSDIPNCNILYLQDGKQLPDICIEPFGANIHDILTQSFFLENGFIGDFAQKKIKEIIEAINKEKINKENYHEYKKTIDLIGEPLIKNKLMNMISEVYDNTQDRIEMLQKEIECLKNKNKK